MSLFAGNLAPRICGRCPQPAIFLTLHRGYSTTSRLRRETSARPQRAPGAARAAERASKLIFFDGPAVATHQHGHTHPHPPTPTTHTPHTQPVFLAYGQVRGDAWASRSPSGYRRGSWVRHQGGLARVEEGILGEVLGYHGSSTGWRVNGATYQPPRLSVGGTALWFNKETETANVLGGGFRARTRSCNNAPPILGQCAAK